LSDSKFFKGWKDQAKELQTQTYALYIAYRDPRVPWYARIFAALVVAYAFSPIDLIPDFIPVLGYLDDLILVPIGIGLALKMIPEAVMQESRIKAQQAFREGKPTNWVAAMVVVSLWLLFSALLIWVFIRAVQIG
jgi:uncharacterized membrane protein YkvA (DUF1232 family)